MIRYCINFLNISSWVKIFLLFYSFCKLFFKAKLRTDEKEFLKKILKGEQVTSMDQLLEFLEKEPDQPTTPIEEL